MRRATHGSKYKIPSEYGCSHCVRAKCQSHPHTRIKTEEKIPRHPGEHIVSDICGPFFPSTEGLRNVEVFMCEGSYYVHAECYKTKSEHPWGVQRAILEFRTQSSRPVRTDGCGTMRSKAVQEFYTARGHNIRHTMSGPHESNSNGRIENLIRTSSEGVRTAMIRSNAPPSFTNECYQWWIFAWNRLNILADHLRPGQYCSSLNILQANRLPYPIECLREFGVGCHSKLPTEYLSRFGGKHQNVPRAFEGIFVGYCTHNL